MVWFPTLLSIRSRDRTTNQLLLTLSGVADRTRRVQFSRSVTATSDTNESAAHYSSDCGQLTRHSPKQSVTRRQAALIRQWQYHRRD